MSQQDQGPVQPLESAGSVGRAVLDRLIGPNGQNTAPAPEGQTGYTDPIAPEVAAVGLDTCPNCTEKLEESGLCGNCGFDKAVRLF